MLPPTEEWEHHHHDAPDVEGSLSSQGFVRGGVRGWFNLPHPECDVAIWQQDRHLWRDDGSGEVLRIVDLFTQGARTIEVRDSPLAIGQADAVEELVGWCREARGCASYDR